MPPVTQKPEWLELKLHQKEAAHFSLRDLLDSPSRFHDFCLRLDGVLFDFSKHLVTPETRDLLISLARSCGVEELRDSMFLGEKINLSENRPVLHTALRAPKSAQILVDGENVIPFVHDVLNRMIAFSNAVRSGDHKGFTGKLITDIVSIGIGGSDLGPRFVTSALRDYHDGPAVHFISNVDGSAISSVLKGVSPETTLFVIASKTFTTEETMLNAKVAKEWFLKLAPEAAIAQHFVALSTNEADVVRFGIAKENMFPFREWVGGRYSVWSAIGLPVMLAVGPENFHAFLAGAYTMDQHFCSVPLENNIPVTMALLGIWYRNFFNYPSHLFLPYDDRLARLAKFIQQMDMESNGKSVDRDGNSVSCETGPVIFGEPGTDSQHSFMQLVHQGTTPIPADFIAVKKPHHDLKRNHASLLANCLAQSRALALGQTLAEAAGDPFRVFPGNRPSTTIILPELSPYTLGLLIAAYEHKVFVQGVIWNLNSFDQPGVELGKKLAKPVRAILEGNPATEKMDSSTDGLLRALLR
jgi:glucose-6-phosphate isomerase